MGDDGREMDAGMEEWERGEWVRKQEGRQEGGQGDEGDA